MVKQIAGNGNINDVRVFGRYLRVSPQKLNLVARLIRRLHVEEALGVLSFSKKRIAVDVKKLLMSAISNAQNNYNLDIDELYVSEAFVGKSIVMKRVMYKSKGKGEHMHKPFSNMTIILSKKNKTGNNVINNTKNTEVK